MPSSSTKKSSSSSSRHLTNNSPNKALIENLEVLKQQVQKVTAPNSVIDYETKNKIRNDLKRFSKVLKKSRARLSELEQISKDCDEISLLRTTGIYEGIKEVCKRNERLSKCLFCSR